MPDPKEETRRSAQFDPQREESAVKAASKAVSSKRQKDPGKLDKNATGKDHPGDPRSGSDSDASTKRRGN